jgi:predicted nucleic-acid-binding protein
MRAIDTNVVVRLVSRDDPRQTASAESFVEGGAWVSVLALAEATWVLGTVYGLTSNELAKAIEMLLNHRDLALQEPEVVVAALELLRAKPSLKFSDCLIVHLARKAGHLPLGTFDRALARAEGVQQM